MRYTKKNNHLKADEGKSFHMINDFGHYEEDKYIEPSLISEMYLAKSLTKEDALKEYEEISLDDLEELKKEWQQELDKQIVAEQNIVDAEFTEIETEVE